MPCSFSSSAARALDASLGQLQKRMISRSRGTSRRLASRSSIEAATAPLIGSRSFSGLLRRSTISTSSPDSSRSRSSPAVIRATASLRRKRRRCRNFQTSQAPNQQQSQAGTHPQAVRCHGLELLAEDIAQATVESDPEHGSQGVPHQESAETGAGGARQRRGDCIQPGDELGGQHRPVSVADVGILGLSDARIRLQRNAAQLAEDAGAAPPPELKPDAVSEQTGRESPEQDQPRVQSAASGQRSRSQHQRNRRQRQSPLFGQNPEEQQGVTVAQQKLNRVDHFKLSLPETVPWARGYRISQLQGL